MIALLLIAIGIAVLGFRRTGAAVLIGAAVGLAALALVLSIAG